ncbi:ferredoxin-type protein NapF [Vibrio sp. HA2012]|uniref:ferredoxin-type protein NapF n=1 Tax=Vibrio sp. HA2012 TaxID=1971595 RepID=UPI000C2C163B|nr:ferredoxin-type protein NapF [Vibrio sp. HA2012]PJC86867.1 ferredoxin-type protein NapF [Vibrio sp. HA2012]
MVDITRRRLFSRLPKAHINNQVPERMPWTVAEPAFVESCTRCGKCIGVCETGIIISGEGGFPEIDFHRGECTFCGLCLQGCTEPVFISQTQLPWQQVADIGEQCLAYHGVECRSCGDMCGYAAIQFHLQAGKIAVPVVNLDECTGCGACIRPCPVDAITINNRLGTDK